MSATGHIRKRTGKDGTLRYQIIVETDTDKHTGKRHRIYKTVHGNQKEAKRVMQQLIYDVSNQAFIKNNNMTVGDWMKKWYDTYLTGKSPSTTRGYLDQLNRYIIPKFGDVRLQEFNNIDIQEWCNELQIKSPVSDNPLSPKTIKNIFNNISAAMRKAVTIGIIGKNPCDGIVLPKYEKYKGTAYTQDEASLLLEKANGTDMYLPLTILLTLGLRRGELLALKWKHIDFEKGVIHIIDNLIGVGNDMITKSPKSESGKRNIIISSHLLSLLKESKKLCQYNGGKILIGAALEEHYIVCKDDGMPFHPNSFTRKFQRFLEHNHLRKIRLHDLRHTNATLMLCGGVSAKVAQMRLGHSDYSTTMNIYSHVVQSLEDDAAVKLDDIIFGKASNG